MLLPLLLKLWWSFGYVCNSAVCSLRFEEFDIEGSTNGDCNYDYVALYNGPDLNSPLIGRYCGNALPDNVVSLTNEMTVQFKTDSSVTKGGFRAIYTEGRGQSRILHVVNCVLSAVRLVVDRTHMC